MKKSSISRFFPPGRKYKAELGVIIGFGIIVYIISIGTYISRYSFALREIEKFHSMNNMGYFNDYIVSIFGAYWFFLLICIVWAVILIWYFLHNRSIYIMKRLDSGRELFLRTAVVPLFLAVTGFAVCILAILLMHHHFYTATPTKYLLPDEPIEFLWAFIPQRLLALFRTVGMH